MRTKISTKDLLIDNAPNAFEKLLMAQRLYVVGKILEKCIDITKQFQQSDQLQNIYRYSKIVDYSDKGFDCSNAKAILYLLEKDPINEGLLSSIEDFDLDYLIDSVYSKMDSSKDDE